METKRQRFIITEEQKREVKSILEGLGHLHVSFNFAGDISSNYIRAMGKHCTALYCSSERKFMVLTKSEHLNTNDMEETILELRQQTEIAQRINNILGR